jgi:long-chain fatty acid transport protein
MEIHPPPFTNIKQKGLDTSIQFGMVTKINKECSMKKRLLALSILTITANTAYANAVQSFADFTFDNPAYYGLIKDREVTLGGLMVFPTVQFNGTSTPVGGTGRAVSTIERSNPFGRIAMRVLRPLVIGVNISSPWASNLVYPSNSVVRYSNTKAEFQSIAITPTVALNFSESFAIGAGIDFQNFYAALSLRIPSGFGDLPLSVSGDSWRYPFKVGAVYVYNKRAVFGLSYHNYVTHRISGTSNFNGIRTPANATVALPATLVGDIKFAITPTIAVFGSARYSLWEGLNTVFINTNGPLGTLPFPLNYTNTWNLLGGGQYKFNSKITARGFGYWDQNPANDTDRGVGLPADTIFGIGVGADYNFNEKMSVTGRYSHAFVNTDVNNLNSAGIRIRGPVNINADAIALQFSYKA